MDQAAKGAAALASSNFSAAVDHYNEAISLNPQAVDYYIKRSTVHTRTSPPNYSLALRDAELALVLAHQRAKRELILQSQLRRGIALFGLQRWGDSKQCFEWVKKLDEKEKTVAIWELKVNAKLKALSEDDSATKVTIAQLPEVELPKATVGTKKKEPEPVQNGTSTDKAAEPAVQTPASKIRHEWYQTTDSVVVSLFAKGVPKDKATINIQPRSLAISFPLSTGSDFDFSLDPLFRVIDPAASTSKVMSTKIECVLKKSDPGIKWAAIESVEAAESTEPPSEEGNADVKRAVLGQQTISNGPPSYPTSSKSGPKDWDKIVKGFRPKPRARTEGEEAATGDENAQDNEDPNEINGDDDPDENQFFKQIFSSASPEGQRAMMKSYQESNGTVLSTNWDEVSKGKVETSPPEGMVAKKWGE